jgi:hypothetical protein
VRRRRRFVRGEFVDGGTFDCGTFAGHVLASSNVNRGCRRRTGLRGVA